MGETIPRRRPSWRAPSCPQCVRMGIGEPLQRFQRLGRHRRAWMDMDRPLCGRPNGRSHWI